MFGMTVDEVEKKYAEGYNPASYYEADPRLKHAIGGKTRSSILISCGARLAPFDIREVRELMEDDEMELPAKPVPPPSDPSGLVIGPIRTR